MSTFMVAMPSYQDRLSSVHKFKQFCVHMKEILMIKNIFPSYEKQCLGSELESEKTIQDLF